MQICPYRAANLSALLSLPYNYSMQYTVLYFDLDDTLYANTNGLWDAIGRRMNEYLRDRMGFPAEEISEIRQTYFETYGTTLRGLQINHSVDADDYLAFVHDLPIEEYIPPDPGLRALLISLPQPKWIFTNADSNHAERVLGILGVQDCFEGIIDVRALGFLCKPEKDAYQRAISLVNGNDPEQCVLFDDSARNLEPARKLGFTTVLVGTDQNHPAANYAVNSLKELRQVFPRLWSAD